MTTTAKRDGKKPRINYAKNEKKEKALDSILRILDKNKHGLTTGAINQEVTVSYPYVIRYLKELQEQGLVKRILGFYSNGERHGVRTVWVRTQKTSDDRRHYYTLKQQILNALKENREGLTRKKLAEITKCSADTITRTVSHLECSGIVDHLILANRGSFERDIIKLKPTRYN